MHVSFWRSLALLTTFCLLFPFCSGCMRTGKTDGESSGLPDDAELNADSLKTVYLLTGCEINVREYGAVGDGVTDDRQAIDTALKKAKDTGSPLYFPAGRYRIDSNIQFPQTVPLVFSDGASLLNETANVQVSAYLYASSHCLFEGNGSYTVKLKNRAADPIWFGAAGDGTTDDTKAFQQAIDAGSEVLIPFSPSGFLIGDLTLTKSILIHGALSEKGEQTKLIGRADTVNLFGIQSNSIQITDLDIDMSKTDKASTFYFDTSSVGHTDYLIRSVNVTGAYRVISDAGVVTNYVTNFIADGLNCYASRGCSFVLRCFWGFIFFRNLVIDSSRTEELYGLRPNYAAIVLENNAGCVFQNIKIIGDGNNRSQNAHAFQYNNNVATWMDNCEFVNISGSCIFTKGNNSDLYFSNLKATGCQKTPFSFKNIRQFQIHAVTVSDCSGKEADGMLFSNCHAAQITVVEISVTAGKGIQLTSCDDMAFVNCRVLGTSDNAVASEYSDGVVFVDCGENVGET